MGNYNQKKNHCDFWDIGLHLNFLSGIFESWCLAKPIQYCKVKKNNNKKQIREKNKIIIIYDIYELFLKHFWVASIRHFGRYKRFTKVSLFDLKELWYHLTKQKIKKNTK